MIVQVVRPGRIDCDSDTVLKIEGRFMGATISDSIVVIYLKEELK